VRARQPSQTAALVAFVRALADGGLTSAPGFADPVARELLPLPWRIAHDVVAPWARLALPPYRRRAVEQLDVVPLRVLAIDGELEDAIAAGCRQVVILGAGLDTRAFRMTALGDADVFEVDHPGTQAFKQRKAAALPPFARRLTYVPVDFERDALGARLAAAGHRADLPTVWIWEGVVMYLTDDAFRATVAEVAERSAPGSVLVVHYHEPDAESASSGLRLALTLWREPQVGLRTRDEMQEALAGAGFEVLRDTNPDEWARRFDAQPPASELSHVTRLVTARRPRPRPRPRRRRAPASRPA
jgi:methyltransferase (TIGR00027 family)